ncbi:MAG: hypothetical protein O2910_07175 [Proteobacteria bacterium]|nr:hypothetical protein [Pseudomonadota bacterium]
MLKAVKNHLKVFGIAIVFGLSVYALLMLLAIVVGLVQANT